MAKERDFQGELNEFLDTLGKESKTLQHEAPEGFIKQVGDTVGSWVRCSPIQGVVRGAKLTDSSFDDHKSAALVLVDITKPCVVDADGEFQIAQVGDTVGVWYKPGMRPLRYLCGQEVWMMESGTKDTGKGNEMITFDIRSPGRQRDPMLILDDYREVSRPALDVNGHVVGMHDLEPAPRPRQLPV